jgi:MFS family permease
LITRLGIQAAPAIVADLGGGSTLVKWLGASYALAMGTLLVVGGRLGDRYGQRRVFLVGMAGFTLASAACGLALSPGMLIAARILQGGLGALLIPQGIAIMTKTFPRDMLAKAFAVFGPLLGVAGRHGRRGTGRSLLYAHRIPFRQKGCGA